MWYSTDNILRFTITNQKLNVLVLGIVHSQIQWRKFLQCATNCGVTKLLSLIEKNSRKNP